MRIHLPALLLLLAACSGPPATDRGASTEAAEAAEAATPANALAAPGTAARQEPDLPDFGDPARFLSLDSLRWAEWETQPPADREARLRALGIQPIRADSVIEFDPADGYDPNGERAADFHFADFSGDGVADVVYNGPWFVRNENGFGALEGTRMRLFQVIGGRAVEVLSHHGQLQRIWKGRPGEPVVFRSVAYGCCSDPTWEIQYFRPVRSGDTVRYEPYQGVQGRAEMRMPSRFLPAPRRFTVANDGYLLRDAPSIGAAAIEEGADWYRWEGHGNALAEYGRGARGIAIAEQTDGTGRVWWFVRMDGRTPPRDAQFVDDPARGFPMDRLGWMSSRFVEVQP